MSIPFQFVPVSHAALDAAEQAGVSAAAQAAYVHLCRHQSGGVTTMGLTRLARKLCCSEDAAARYVQELKDADLIRIEARPGRCNAYCILAWQDGTPRKSRDVLEASKNSPEEQPQAVPIRDQGSDLDKPRGIVGRVVETVKAWSPVKPRKRLADWTPEPPVKKDPEPVEAPGDAAPLEAGCPPAREEQPRPAVPVVTDVITAQTYQGAPAGPSAEDAGLPAPEADSGFVRDLFWKACRPSPDGQWYYRNALMSASELLEQPGAKMARIIPADLEQRRKDVALPGLRARL